MSSLLAKSVNAKSLSRPDFLSHPGDMGSSAQAERRRLKKELEEMAARVCHQADELGNALARTFRELAETQSGISDEFKELIVPELVALEDAAANLQQLAKDLKYQYGKASGDRWTF